MIERERSGDDEFPAIVGGDLRTHGPRERDVLVQVRGRFTQKVVSEHDAA